MVWWEMWTKTAPGGDVDVLSTLCRSLGSDDQQRPDCYSLTFVVSMKVIPRSYHQYVCPAQSRCFPINMLEPRHSLPPLYHGLCVCCCWCCWSCSVHGVCHVLTENPITLCCYSNRFVALSVRRMRVRAVTSSLSCYCFGSDGVRI